MDTLVVTEMCYCLFALLVGDTAMPPEVRLSTLLPGLLHYILRPAFLPAFFFVLVSYVVLLDFFFYFFSFSKCFSFVFGVEAGVGVYSTGARRTYK